MNRLYYGEDPMSAQPAFPDQKVSLLARTHLVISRLPVDEATRENYRQSAEKYFNECGCTLGTFFLIGTIAFLILDWFFLGGPYFSFLTGILLAFSAALLGKLLGIGIGRIRLFILFKKLCRSRACDVMNGSE